MKTEVRWSSQVADFTASLAPEPRKKLRAAIRALADDKGNIRPLVDDLLGYHRLRVGDLRVIYREGFTSGKRICFCLFSERRDVVYELFRKMVLDDIRN
jgi:mRNA-degrading endonuclease RelE of RelBE toxin-antitoxin system